MGKINKNLKIRNKKENPIQKQLAFIEKNIALVIHFSKYCSFQEKYPFSHSKL